MPGVPAPVSGTVQSRWPRSAATKSVLLAQASPLGDASVVVHVTIGLRKEGLVQVPSHVGQP